MKLVPTSYRPEDVTVLLRDITGLVEPQPASVRERLIQTGVHYCEMLPLEYEPGEDYLRQYEAALENFSAVTAAAVAAVSEKIYRRHNGNICLVSLARAGISAGVLIKHYIAGKYGSKRSPEHYAVSIIRGRGIDRNAMDYILKRHPQKDICFVDGWTGKGAIAGQLAQAMSDYPGVDPSLAVIADPAGITPLCGSHEDFLIASSCLNSVVSGLISRTFLRDDIIAPSDFHGAAYYGDLRDRDRTYEFIDAVEKNIRYDNVPVIPEGLSDNRGQLREIARHFGIDDINLIKPGIGETTRVLLRRIPDRVLIAKGCDEFYISHILRLAEEKGVTVEEYPLHGYRCCGIIARLADS